MKAELVPLNGDAPIPITRDVTLIGRREFCDVVVPHASLSKRHCVLVRTDGLLIVRDLISTNGTKVNGQRVMWAALLPNDKLTLGRLKFKVYLGPDSEVSPSELGRRNGEQARGVYAPIPGGQAPAPGPAAALAAGGFAAPSPQPQSAIAHSEVPDRPDFALDQAEFDEPDDLGLDILDDEDEPMEPYVVELDD